MVPPKGRSGEGLDAAPRRPETIIRRQVEGYPAIARGASDRARARPRRAAFWDAPSGYFYESLLQHDKIGLELSWIPDESLEDSASLPDPDEIVEDLRGALAEFEAVQEELSPTQSG
jgi:hypothetical protein